MKPGDKMPDGTIYAGISPDTGKPMYTTPLDAPLSMKFNEAKEYAAKLDVHGHQDWHLPTKGELNVLFNNRAAIGGFDFKKTDEFVYSRYWSSTQYFRWGAWTQYFLLHPSAPDGWQNGDPKRGSARVRCVRGDKPTQ